MQHKCTEREPSALILYFLCPTLHLATFLRFALFFFFFFLEICLCVFHSRFFHFCCPSSFGKPVNHRWALLLRRRGRSCQINAAWVCITAAEVELRLQTSLKAHSFRIQIPLCYHLRNVPFVVVTFSWNPLRAATLSKHTRASRFKFKQEIKHGFRCTLSSNL